jgi:hypothetical protein
MKCHKLLQHEPRMCPECLCEQCSLWNTDRQECAEKTFMSSWGAIYALQAKMQYLLTKIDEDLEGE